MARTPALPLLVHFHLVSIQPLLAVNFLWQVVEAESEAEEVEARMANEIIPASTPHCLGFIRITHSAAVKFGARSDLAKYLPSQHQRLIGVASVWPGTLTVNAI